MRWICFCLGLMLTTGPLAAQDTLGLAAPPVVSDSGLLQYMLPRFSLKTGIRVVADPGGLMELTPDAPGTPVFRDTETVYHLRFAPDDPRQVRFADWLSSEIGKRTIDSFALDGVAPFSSDLGAVVVVEEIGFDGDHVAGGKLSLVHCGRCHVIGPQNAMNGIGSTPSFAVLRALPDWDVRFQQFYVRRPHGAFTQIETVTAPFDPALPSPIHPLQITLDDLQAILAFVTQVSPADLGAPLHLQ